VGDALAAKLRAPAVVVFRRTSRFSSFGRGGRMEIPSTEDDQRRVSLVTFASFDTAYALALRAAQIRARAAVASGAIQPADRQDIEQEGLIACRRALPYFDPTRASLRTFVEHVVRAHLISLSRARRCRPHFQPLSDDQLSAGNDWAYEIELRSDVHRVLGSLPDTDRRIALLLMEHSPSRASRMLGVARSTVYKCIYRLRVRFTTAGFSPGCCATCAKRPDAIRPGTAEPASKASEVKLARRR